MCFISWSVSVSWFSYVKPAVSSRSGQINRGKKKKKDCAQERKRFQQSCMLWERRRKSNIHLICCLACDFFRCQNHGGACFHLKVNSALYLAASSAAHSEPGETIFSWLIRLHPALPRQPVQCNAACCGGFSSLNTSPQDLQPSPNWFNIN